MKQNQIRVDNLMKHKVQILIAAHDCSGSTRVSCALVTMTAKDLLQLKEQAAQCAFLRQQQPTLQSFRYWFNPCVWLKHSDKLEELLCDGNDYKILAKPLRVTKSHVCLPDCQHTEVLHDGEVFFDAYFDDQQVEASLPKEAIELALAMLSPKLPKK